MPRLGHDMQCELTIDSDGEEVVVVLSFFEAGDSKEPSLPCIYIEPEAAVWFAAQLSAVGVAAYEAARIAGEGEPSG